MTNKLEFDHDNYQTICKIGNWVACQDEQVEREDIVKVARLLKSGKSKEEAIGLLASHIGHHMTRIMEESGLDEDTAIQCLLASYAHALVTLTYTRGFGDN